LKSVTGTAFDVRALYGAYLSLNSAVVPARIQDILLKFGKKYFRTKFLLIASMPRSGSTHLTHSVAGIPGWRNRTAVPSYGRREYELEAEQIRRDWIAARSHVVFGHHVRCSEHTLALVRYYGLDVVVLVRNVKDVCRSFSDYLDTGYLTWPFAFIDEATLSHIDRNGTRPSLIASTFLPWLVNFYVGWKKYEQSGGRVLFLRYEELVDDSVGSLARLMAYIGCSVDEETIQDAVASVASTPTQGRMNVGIVGRGGNYFSDESIADALIENFTASYPDIDFSLICS